MNGPAKRKCLPQAEQSAKPNAAGCKDRKTKVTSVARKTAGSDFLVFFYSNPAIWSRLGYEGPSNDRGGYLHRGFNDIDWIKREEL